MKISIIGAGIGGLTAAIAMQQNGFDVEIFEKSASFKKAGSGINLALNAMQVYKKLGIYDEISASGSHTSSLNITDESFNILSKVNLADFENEFGCKTFAIHRATLHTILLNKLNKAKITLNKELYSVTQSDTQVSFTFQDGTSHNSDILIGADGIHSTVRKSIFGNKDLRKAKQVCWRGIVKTHTSSKYQTELNEMWGEGKRFGFVNINEEEVYWYALANYKKDYKQEFTDLNLAAFFSKFNPIVSRLISNTKKENIIFNEMLDLKPIPSWHQGNVCLIGDAAHATTPNMGQGACQAIESAFTLAQCLKKYRDNVAFAQFQKLRQTKANRVVRASWKLGKVSHLSNPILMKIRNQMIKMIPDSINRKQSEKLFKLDKI